MQKQGIFTSLGRNNSGRASQDKRNKTPEETDRSTGRYDKQAGFRDTGRDQWQDSLGFNDNGGMSFRNRIDYGSSTGRDTGKIIGGSGSLNISPLKIESAGDSGNKAFTRIDLSPYRPVHNQQTYTFSPSMINPVMLSNLIAPSIVSPATSIVVGPQQAPTTQTSFKPVQSVPSGQPIRISHPVHTVPTVKTIIQTPVPIINPVVVDAPTNNQQVDKLNDEIQLLMQQYEHLYGLYEDLKKKNEQNINLQPEIIKIQKKQPEPKTQSLNKMRTVTLLNDFQRNMFDAIDRIINERLKDGERQIRIIASSSQIVTETSYY